MSGCAWGCTDFAPDDSDCLRYGMGAMALRYAWMGYAVLPLARGGKRPHRMLGDRGGVHRATRDPDEIRELWSLDMAANVGVATGSPSRLAVVDLDMKHGVNGVESWNSFTDGPPPAPWPDGVPEACTPSGGRHLWLRVPEGAVVPDRPGILPGVDVKGDGGYVAAYPSMIATVPHDRSGGGTGEVHVPYTWAAGCPHEAPGAPGWLLPWLGSAVGVSRADGRDHPDDRDEGDVPDESAGLETGNRNRGMYRLACSLYRRMGTDPQASSAVLERLHAVWDKTDHYDFGWSEVLTCAESARRFIERSRAWEDARNQKFLEWLYGPK